MIYDLHKPKGKTQGQNTKKPESKNYGTLSGRILLLGFGSCGQAILPLLLRHLTFDIKKLTVIEIGENEKLFKLRYPDINYVKSTIVEENLNEELSKYVGDDGDFIIDLSTDIDAIAITTWCYEHDVMYINTSLERWKPIVDEVIPKMGERTLYHAHQQIRKAIASWKKESATCILVHGANPGAVSHLTKQALLNIVALKKLNIKTPQTQQGWARLAQKLKVKAIQISERDTQIIDIPKEVDSFVCTWSPEGMMAEARAPAEMGYGSHELPTPYNGVVQGGSAYLKQPGCGTLVKGWVPVEGQYNGFMIQHSEAITISEYFSIGNYRPTVYYCYCAPDCAVNSLFEFRGRELDTDTTKRVVKDEILSGMDELGVLVLCDDITLWCGSLMSIDNARKLVEHETPTTLQVAGSMLGAIVWAIKNPKEGVKEPEDLPFDEIMNVAFEYWAPLVSVKTDWKPTHDRTLLFPIDLDKENPLRFENFLVED